MRLIGYLAALMVLTAGIGASHAKAEPDGTVQYRIQRGDTLYRLSEAYLRDYSATLAIRRLNRIRDPRRLRPGEILRIPRALLKYEPVAVSLVAFSGPVRLTIDGQARAPQVGMRLGEGDVIQTGANGFLSLSAGRGSTIAIPTNSRARIIDARRYALDDSIDVQVRILAGRGEVRAPTLKGQERFRVGTPVAVTAVRGTEFRVAFDPQAGRSLTEVIEGTVAVQLDQSETLANADTGVAAGATGIGAVEDLLPAPDIVEGGRIQTEERAVFVIEPLAGASAYRTQLSRDAGFLEMFGEEVHETAEVGFADLADGRYFIRSRGQAQSGLEGNSKVYSFRRKRLGAAAGVEESPLADAFKFGWRAEGEGESVHGFQLWKDGEPAALIVDEVALQGQAIFVGSLAPATYKWRIAAIQVDEGEFIKVWGPTQELVVSE